MLFVACPSESSSGSESPATQSQEEVNLTAAKDALEITTVVADKTNTTIDLPKNPSGYDDVTVTWESGNTAIITNDGTVTPQDGDGEDTVTLTATIKSGDYTTTKTFSVTVYQKNKTLSADDILSVAQANLLFTYDGATYYPQTVTLPATTTVDGKDVSIAWKAAGDTHLTAAGTTATVTRDIVDIQTSLTATLTYNGKTATKDIPVTVTHIPEFTRTYTNSSSSYSDDYTYTFDGKTITYTNKYKYDDTESKSGRKYSYTADPAKGQLTVTVTQFYDDDTEKWYTKSEYITFMKNQYDTIIEAYKKAVAEPTIANLLAIQQVFAPNATEDDIYKMLLTHFEESIDTVEKAKAASEEAKKKAVEADLEDAKKDLASMAGLTESASWEEILPALKTYLDSSLETETSSLFKEDVVYAYEIEDKSSYSSSWAYSNKVWFTATGVYDSTKAWYEQNGDYRRNDDTDHSRLAAYSSKRGYFYYTVKDYDETYDTYKTEYTDVTFNDTYTEFTDEDESVWTITENKATKTITVTNKSDSTKTVTLTFEGSSL